MNFEQISYLIFKIPKKSILAASLSKDPLEQLASKMAKYGIPVESHYFKKIEFSKSNFRMYMTLLNILSIVSIQLSICFWTVNVIFANVFPTIQRSLTFLRGHSSFQERWKTLNGWKRSCSTWPTVQKIPFLSLNVNVFHYSF